MDDGMFVAVEMKTAKPLKPAWLERLVRWWRKAIKRERYYVTMDPGEGESTGVWLRVRVDVKKDVITILESGEGRPPEQEALRAELIEFFWPGTDCGNYWGGWNKFFRPALPPRHFDEGLDKIRRAVADPGRAREAIEFLETVHVKKLSRAGRDQPDVMCFPTAEAKKAVRMLEDYRQFGVTGEARVICRS